MKNILSIFLPLLLAFSSSPVKAAANTTAVPSVANTCADPSLASLYVTLFDVSRTTHVIAPRINLIVANTPATGAGEWTWQGPSFRAWETSQPFTSPLYLFFNPQATDYSFILSTTGTTPTPGGGLQNGGIRAYVYASQVCGSVPLYAITQTSVGDHWYTTDVNERNTLVSAGWSDLGILAYVLPLGPDNNCTCGS